MKAQGACEWTRASARIDRGHEGCEARSVFDGFPFENGPKFGLKRHAGAVTGNRE
jgi:hypothetical protein